MTSHDKKRLQEAVDRYASQCVKCALCLPHCPTYELTQDENESPRGRIALFQALAQEKLPLSEPIHKHLDHCLGCRACEPICPAGVQYGALLISGREMIEKTKKSTVPLNVRFLRWLVRKPFLLRILHWVGWILQITRLRALAPGFALKQLNTLLPPIQKPLSQKSYFALSPYRGRVMLFVGCLAPWCDQDTISASIFVLQQLGYDVLPFPQQCCGAIALHAGQWDDAFNLARRVKKTRKNEEKEKRDVDYIVTLATGCGAVMQEYPSHFSFNTGKVIDILSLVAQSQWPDLPLTPLPQEVMLHVPCSQRHVLKTAAHSMQVLARIPQLIIHHFSSPHCCGAAGTYMLTQPALANPLSHVLIAELQDKKINTLLTPNIGCALHLKQQLKKKLPKINLYHPVALLAKAWGF